MRLASSKSLSLPAACGLLVAAVAIVYAPLAFFAYQRHGWPALAAASLAAAVCTASSSFALFVTGRLRGTPSAIQGILAGTLIRMLLPLGVAAVMESQKGMMARGGLFGYMVVFFLLTLLIETGLLLLLYSPSKFDGTKNLVPDKNEGR